MDLADHAGPSPSLCFQNTNLQKKFKELAFLFSIFLSLSVWLKTWGEFQLWDFQTHSFGWDPCLLFPLLILSANQVQLKNYLPQLIAPLFEIWFLSYQCVRRMQTNNRSKPNLKASTLSADKNILAFSNGQLFIIDDCKLYRANAFWWQYTEQKHYSFGFSMDLLLICQNERMVKEKITTELLKERSGLAVGRLCQQARPY